MPIVLSFAPNLQIAGGLGNGVDMTDTWTTSYHDLLSGGPAIYDEVTHETPTGFSVNMNGYSAPVENYFGHFTYPEYPEGTITGVDHYDIFTGDGSAMLWSLSGLPNLPFDMFDFNAFDTIEAHKNGGITVNGTSFADILTGGSGNDLLVGNSGADSLYGGAGNDTLLGGNELAPGIAGSWEVLDGGAGNDYLDPGTGTNGFHSSTSIGGAGDDTYVMRYWGGRDIVAESTGGGFDTVVWWGTSWGGYGPKSNSEIGMVPPNIERFVFEPHNNGFISETIEGAIIIASSSSLQELIGAGGNDYLMGPTGGALIAGNGGDDLVLGRQGNDTLDGGTGSDFLRGMAGNDTYVVESAGDVVWEGDIVSSFTAGFANEPLVGTSNGAQFTIINFDSFTGGYSMGTGPGGIDTVRSFITYAIPNSGFKYVNPAGPNLNNVPIARVTAGIIENLELQGTAAIDGTGNKLDNVLTGNSGSNTLNGAAGNDTLNGGIGADTMIGGAGNDTFVVNSTLDVVTEALNAGTDTVQAPRSYSLAAAANVENLTLLGTANFNGTGNTLNNVLTGNTGDNRLTGDSGNDTLNGGLGNDTMIGGAGNDTYVRNAAGDVVTEAANAGTDTVQSALAYALSVDVENLTLTGAASINGTGSTRSNVLTGNSGNNILTGNSGNDTLNGGLGADTLNGGAGVDVFLFNSALGAANIDRVTGYSVADDTIQLENAIFTSLTSTGTLSAANFRAGPGRTAAADGNDFIIYNTSNGQLYYDAGGNTGAASQHFATLTGILALAYNDFVVV